MAALKFRGVSGAVALTANVPRTVLQLAAPANQRVKFIGFGVSFNSVNSADVPTTVRLVRQTSAGAGGTTVNLRPVDDDLPETIQTTALGAPTSEPTNSGIVLYDEYQPAWNGQYENWIPFSEEIVLAGGTRLGVEVTCTNNVSCKVTVHCEE